MCVCVCVCVCVMISDNWHWLDCTTSVLNLFCLALANFSVFRTFVIMLPNNEVLHNTKFSVCDVTCQNAKISGHQVGEKKGF